MEQLRKELLSPPSSVKVNRNGDKAASYGVWSAADGKFGSDCFGFNSKILVSPWSASIPFD
jgi:hypothetical protein